MKFRDFRIQAYGALDNLLLDFSGPNFQIIYGFNEAGKTTTLHALHEFLFGIGNKTSFGTSETYGRMRLGATLELSSGALLSCTRKKGTKDTLLDSGGQPLPPQVLEPFLAGMDSVRFEQMFGLTHDRLRKGGEEIVQGGGEVGQTLFAAAMGSIVNLRGVRKSLNDEAERLFKPRGSTSELSKILSEWEAADKEKKAAVLKARDWEEREQEKTRLDEADKQLEGALWALRAELANLENRRTAREQVIERQQVLEEMAGLAGAPVLPRSFPDEFQEARNMRLKAVSVLENQQTQVKQLQERVTAFPPEDPVLSRKSSIESLAGKASIFRKEEKESAEKEEELRREDIRCLEILRRIEADGNLETAATLLIPPKERSELLKLVRKHAEIEALLKKAREERAHKELEEEEVLRKQKNWVAVPDATLLQGALKQAGKYESLEQNLDKLRAKLHKEDHVIHRDLAAMGRVWTGALEVLEAISLPAEETVRAAEKCLTDAREEARKAHLQWEERDQDVEKAEAKLLGISGGGEVPTLERLDAARSRRDEGWRLVRADWLEGAQEPARMAAFAGELSLADAYEARVREADSLADALRTGLERAVQFEEARRRVQELQTRRDQANSEKSRREAALEAAAASWEELWVPLGIRPVTPGEIRQWLGQRESLLKRAESVRELSAEVAAQEASVTRARESLLTALAGIGAAGDPKTAASLEVLTSVARETAASIEAKSQEFKDLQREIGETARQKEQASGGVETQVRELGVWQESWVALLHRIGWPAEFDPSEADDRLKDLDELAKVLQKREDLRYRLTQLKDTMAGYQDEAAVLFGDLVPALLDQPLLDGVAALSKQLKEATGLAGQKAAIIEEEGKARKLLEHYQNELKAAEIRLRELSKEAGVEDPSELPETINRSHRLQQLQEKLSVVEAQLRLRAHEEPLEVFCEQVLALDLETVATRLEELRATLTNKEEERLKLREDRGKVDQQIKDGAAGKGAVEAAGRTASLAARANEIAADYLRLRMASKLLDEEVERFRKTQQGPLLKRTGALIHDLSLGSFVGLEVDFDDKDQAQIVGIRPSEHRIPVARMSEGAADQLYFALRLASLELYQENHEPMPLILDDVLIQFDDRRARQALKTLREFSSGTQILFFTHHARIVELAKATLKEDMKVVELPDLGSRAQGL